MKLGQKGSEWERFWRRVKVLENGCWQWIGGSHSRGYGGFTLAGGKKRVRAHRWAYEKCIGPIPEGLGLDHLCRNHACVNPLHLEPVTDRINILRSPISLASINAKKTVCLRGHPFTHLNTEGKRVCRTCLRFHDRKHKQKLKGQKK